MELPSTAGAEDLGIDKDVFLISPPARGVVHHHPHIHPYLGSCQPHAIIPASLRKVTGLYGLKQKALKQKVG